MKSLILPRLLTLCLSLSVAHLLQSQALSDTIYCNFGDDVSVFDLSQSPASQPIVSSNGTLFSLSTTASNQFEHIVDFFLPGNARLSVAGQPLVELYVGSIDPTASLGVNAVYFDAAGAFTGEVSLGGTSAAGVISVDASSSPPVGSDSYFLRLRIGNLTTTAGSTITIDEIHIADSNGFTTCPIPEPSAALLICLAGILTASQRKR